MSQQSEGRNGAVLPSACPNVYGPLRRKGGARAVFLDRDGVLIEDTGYPSDPTAIALLPGVGEALYRLQSAGWRLVVVSNQSGVARGKFDLIRLDQIHARLCSLLAASGVELDALYFCPHHPAGSQAPFNTGCDHRKPSPGMLYSAAQRLGLLLDACWMVGDKESDVQAARAAGVRAIRLDADGSREATGAAALARDLPEAAGIILAGEPGRGAADSGAG